MKSDTRPVNRIAPLDRAIADYTTSGWRVTMRQPDGVQMTRAKQWDGVLLTIGFAGLIFGFGLVFLILATLDYLLKSEPVVYITNEQVVSGNAPSPRVKSFSWLLLGFGLFFTLVYFSCVILVLAG